MLNVAQNRLDTYLRTRKVIKPNDLGKDVAALLLRKRSALILQNEQEVAQNFGTQLLLMNAQKEGWLGADARKVWVTAIDERVCPVCRPMDSVAVPINDPFTIRGHHGVLSHDVRLWVPPAHPGCRCRIVPERVIEHGIITRTARFSSNSAGRARLKSELADLITTAQPSWMDSDVGKLWTPDLHPRGKAGKFVLAGLAAGVVANEARQVYQTHQQTKYGYAMTSGIIPRKRFRSIKGVSNAPVGTKLTSATLPEGTYLVSMAALAGVRSKTSISPSENPAALRQSMARNGFTHPVHLRAYADGAELWDGNHRLNLAEELEMDAVPVKVIHIAGDKPKAKTVLDALNRWEQHRYRAKIVARYAAS